MKGQQWVMVKHFQGLPKDGDMKLIEEDLPEVKDGEILLEAEAWSVDPYMRPMSNKVAVGDMIPGQNYSKVIQSKNSEYPVGSEVLVNAGWRTHLVCNPATFPPVPSQYPGVVIPSLVKAADTADLPKSLTLGVLGMPAATAYFGFLEICQPKAGETVLVNGASGAVGSLVGQIAKIKGCTVIGFAGADDKVKFLKDELGFDFAYNYKTQDIAECISKAAPNGIDCYFDNVGGNFTHTVIIKHMNAYGRIAVCGSISMYNSDPTKLPTGPEVYSLILVKQLRIEGLVGYRWYDRFPEAFTQILQWIKQGKLQYREHVTVGFENMFAAFQGMLKGENNGKAVIRAK